MMNGQAGGIVDRVANNAWLTAIDRIAVPLIGLLVWNMYSQVQQVPIIAEKVKNLEARADKMDSRADNARAERIAQYQNIIVEVTTLKGQVDSLSGVMKDQAQILRDINQKISDEPRRP